MQVLRTSKVTDSTYTSSCNVNEGHVCAACCGSFGDTKLHWHPDTM